MAQIYDDVHLEWIKLAEEAVQKSDYETAAHFFRYVTIRFGLDNDTPNQREFATKTAECYVNASKKSWMESNPLKAILFCIRAADYFQEGGREELVKDCDSMIRNYYASVKEDGLMKTHGDAQDLKAIGDYFVKKNNFESAIECYRTAADKACNNGKMVLSGGLYRDIGDCYKVKKNFEDAAKNYATAAEMFFKGQEYFEAAWHYCESSFLFILVGRLDKASITARKATHTCNEGRIDVILNDLSYICELLSKKALYEAEERWKRLRMKFKKSYASLVDSCFESLKRT